MRFNIFKSRMTQSGLALVLLLGSGAALAQTTVNLTAGPTTATLPDGSAVPMWGYSCGTAVSGSTGTCAALNPNAGTGGWSPVVITVPTSQSLTINLTNNLSFSTGGTPAANTIPTSIVIIGQLGGGLGNSATSAASPTHNALGTSWPTTNNPGAAFNPPPQGARVQSFTTEVAGSPACTATLTSGCNTTASLTWATPKPGTYLIESGTHPSIQGPMGLYGILVVTAAPTAATTAGAGVAYGTGATAVTYSAELPLVLSEIDPVQNTAVNAAVRTAGFTETTVWSGQPGGCGNPVTSGGTANPAFNTCYPPAVNYTPLYYLINGVAFDKTHASNSLFAATTGTVGSAPAGNNLLVRLVNAGLRMHVPSIVGSTAASTAACYPVAPATTCPPVGGFALIAEDGNVLPGRSRVQSEVFMAAGKTYDVMVQVPATPAGATAPPSLPIYDRELSLSANAVNRDAGMLAYIGVNGAAAPSIAGNNKPAAALADQYPSLVAGQTFNVSDPSKGVIANDTNVFGVTLLTQASNGVVTLYKNGTFTYVPSGTATSDSFTYCANGTVTGTTCSSGLTATVTLAASNIVGTDVVTCTSGQTFNSTMATYLAVKTPGLLAGCTDGAKLPLTIVSVTATGCTVVSDANGGFTASTTGATTCNLSFTAKNSVGDVSGTTTASVVFPAGSGLVVNVLDGTRDPNTGALVNTTPITDYRWVIEEDRTFYINPNCVQNPPPAGCPTATAGIVPTLGVNFHTSYMPFVAQGCTGPLSCEGGQTVLGVQSVCDVSNGVCRPDSTGNGFTQVLPSSVHLDPTKRYYISILPGDAANPFIAGCATAPDAANPTTSCIGHGMGGAPIGIDPNTSKQQSSVTVYSQPSPYQPSKLSVFVFEDDFPLNGEQDGGGGVDVIGPVEPGLGGFEIVLWDAMGGNGDFTGQMTHDMFNQPLSNALDGTIDPLTQNNACPISQQTLTNPGQAGITGRIVTCPKYESDGKTLSPLAGQAVIANLMPMRMGVVASPAADRIARGEEWLQTNTLDGQKAHDAFAKIGEPSYFQEFGPASYHVSIGFANPAIINARLPSVCDGTNANITGKNCNNTLTGMITGQRLSRTPDERLYNSGTHDAFYWTQCYVSVGDPDGIDFAFTKCNADGTFKFTGLPDGDWRITSFDQWNDQLVDGLSTPVRLGGVTCTGANVPSGCNPSPTPHAVNMSIAATQWQTNLYTRTFIDDNRNGLSETGETGIPFANVAVRLRDGSLENLLVTDFTGTANFNESFPLFSWYSVETDVTRYKNTGTHVVYDAGGPADSTPCGGTTGYPPCGTSTIGKNLANTVEQVSVPANLRVPGAIYCAGADCTGKDMSGLSGGTSASSDPPSVCATAPTGVTTCSTTLSTGRIDPPWVGVEGWQGFPGQNNFMEFGKAPYYPGENGGIKGHVVYASTRPFDDPQALVQTQWEPLVPGVTINLYQEGFATDGVTPTLTLVDTTKTTSFDDFAQGFHLGPDGKGGMTSIPNMNCPGQGSTTGATPDLFFFSLYNQPDYLNLYNSQHGGPAVTALPNNSQFKCYDGMHNWNQIQPAPYDGQYQFPSVTSTDPATGKPTGTNCTICANTPDPVPTTGDGADPLRAGLPMLPPGKYVVEVVVPPGMELVKEEDKNILIGDNYIAPVTQEFGALGNIFIIPDQASVAGTFSAGAGYNANSWNNPTQSLGAAPLNGIVPAFVPEPIWPCVGESRIVPDYISLFPQSHQVAPFAGASRNLCDRKEVTLSDQSHSIAKFYVYTSTHIASKFTGGITDDYTSEFDPFSPQFGEKFAPPDMPVSIKDWTGTETNRVYADHWGAYNGMTYSTWEVNPPNPTGYSPTMMVFCMNDPGPITDTRMGSATNGQLITDPLFSQGYSQFCYELPFMPGTTQYLDTPVVPTSAFAGAGYNNVDCAEPDATPAIAEVDGDGVGPYVSAAGNTLTITALGDQMVPNNAYSGPAATTAPYNQKTIKRHYGFGAAQGTGTVTIGGINAPVTNWGDTSITVTVPPGVPNCAIQQQVQYGGSTAQCGQLVITAGNGKQSIDSVTVTVGGKAPTHVPATASVQAAIDAALPGDLIIIDPTCNSNTTGGTTALPSCTTPLTTTGATLSKTIAAHNELLLMWKPVRLQGVGASSSIINANTQPAGKLTPWRARVDCLFGMSLNGTPVGWSNSCGTGWNGFSATATEPQVDRLPFESTIGWTASLSGNLAEQLQEPSLMGALEGAGITVLSKGVDFHGQNPFDPTLLAGFPVGTTLLGAGNCGTTAGPNPFPSNFQCNPSSIDGIGITNSSQGGGGILVHAWAHHLQIANNRIYNNAGTLSGGINLGQGEFPPAYLSGSTTNSPPGSCESGANGIQLPYCHNTYVNVHHNYISLNSSTGDELFSATPAGNGGASICTGADYYQFNYNWVCGNLSSGDGGGVGHMGFSKNGDIEHNSILFNQSTNPTIPTNGGGLLVMGTPDADPTCGATTDQDCVSPLGQVGPSDGIGPGLVINANLIMGNAAESGSGGGIAFQNINGNDVVNFPTTPTQWYHVMVTNNIIANNVAGWDGGGVSLLDALNVDLINNTIVSNVTTASAGVLNNTLGAPLASTHNCPPGQINSTTGVCNVTVSTSTPQPSGLVSINDSAILVASLPATINCPANHYSGTTSKNAACRTASYPLLQNNIFWHNSAYYIAAGALSAQYQQNVVSLYNAFNNSLAGNQTVTGSCTQVAANGSTGTPAPGYWEIGVRGDTAPNTHSSGVTLAPLYSILSDATDYAATNSHNSATNPGFVNQYCNGSRQPPEFAVVSGQGGAGWAVPPGISDATVPNPIFNLTPVATVDEGNNWINMRWGPLSLTNPTATGGANGNYGGGNPLGNYALTASLDGTPAGVPVAQTHPMLDFFGNLRPEPGDNAKFDPGAVEFGSTPPVAALNVTGGPLAFTAAYGGTPPVGYPSAAKTLTLHNTGTAAGSGITLTFSSAVFSRPAGAAGGTCTATLAAGATCTINVVFTPTALGATGAQTLTILASVPVTGSPVGLSGTGVPPVISATLTPTTWNIYHAANCPGTTIAGILACLFDPTQTFTLTNTGNVPLTGITNAVLGGSAANVANWARLSLCGATLAPGATCGVMVQFKPLTAQAAGAKPATISVTDSAGTQTSTLNGTDALAAVTLSAPTPALTTATANTTAKTGTITVSNGAAAAGPLTLIANPTIAKVGGAGGTFSITGGTCASGFAVNAGSSCTIFVQYAPGTSTATATANVTITGSGLATGTQTSANFTAN